MTEEHWIGTEPGRFEEIRCNICSIVFDHSGINSG